MARPERKTVDYFPHYIGDGKKIFVIEHKYGNDGYTAWFKILEQLACAENHYLDLRNDNSLMYLSAKCRITEDRLIEIINDLVQMKEIDAFLWSNKIIWCDRFIESIQDAYSRRTNKCITYTDLCTTLTGLTSLNPPTETQKKEVFDDNNTQSKVKYTKVKKSKEKETKVNSLSGKEPDDVIDWNSLLEFVNNLFGRDFRVFSLNTKTAYKARLKQGYSKENIKAAMESARASPFHQSNGFQYCTLEFFSRESTLQKYSPKKNQNVKSNGNQQNFQPNKAASTQNQRQEYEQ